MLCYIPFGDVGGNDMSDNSNQQKNSTEKPQNNGSNNPQRPVPQIKQQYGKDLSGMEKRSK